MPRYRSAGQDREALLGYLATAWQDRIGMSPRASFLPPRAYHFFVAPSASEGSLPYHPHMGTPNMSEGFLFLFELRK
jgi:hypothetical protein